MTLQEEMAEEKTYKVKALMDDLKEEPTEMLIAILDCIPNQYDDDVYEFEITISKIKNITDEIGVNSENCRDFSGVEVIEKNKAGEE